MRFKTWPLYGNWVEIFGKDRATGECAEGFVDVFDKVQSMSVSNANTSGSSKSDKRKRKMVDENDDRFIDLMSSFCDKTDNRLGDISRRIGFEHDASMSRKAVLEALGEVSSLDMEAMIMVSHLIVNNTKNMDLFFSLSNNGRKNYGEDDFGRQVSWKGNYCLREFMGCMLRCRYAISWSL
ncbi:hypothetical protein BUALT_Bualt06G0006900 [Buddleja alternifolia]|uniref:Uncharacterized protein n=1 Tax=Buddleja alternifolia TaxID=168488 RepID=A0AAV6XMR9_9LAMI|nr:hypothetical protein BUALT_Bualt06G0006900 [Buddleja alternifolia]